MNRWKILKYILLKDVRYVDWVQFASVNVPMKYGEYFGLMWFCYLPNKDGSMEFVILL